MQGDQQDHEQAQQSAPPAVDDSPGAASESPGGANTQEASGPQQPTGQQPPTAPRRPTDQQPPTAPQQPTGQEQRTVPGAQATGGPTESTPQQQLEQLRKAQQEADAKAKRDAEASQALKADITALERTLQDVETAATAYGKARPSLQQQRDDQATAITPARRENIKRAVGDRKDDVDRAVADVQDAIEQLHCTRDEQWENLIRLAQDRLAAERYLTRARDRFDGAKGRQTTVTGRVTRLKELVQELDTAEDEGKRTRTYATLKEHDRQLDLIGDDAELEPVDAYRAELIRLWDAVSDAQTALRTVTQREADEQRALQMTKDEIARLESKRVDEAVARVESSYSGATTSAPPST